MQTQLFPDTDEKDRFEDETPTGGSADTGAVSRRVEAYGIAFELSEIRKSGELLQEAEAIQEKAAAAYQEGDNERRMELVKKASGIRNEGLAPMHNHSRLPDDHRAHSKKSRTTIGEVAAQKVSEETGRDYEHRRTIRQSWYAVEMKREQAKSTYLALASIEEDWGLDVEVKVHWVARETGRPSWNKQSGQPKSGLSVLERWNEEPLIAREVPMGNMPGPIIKHRVQRAFWNLVTEHTAMELPEGKRK